jgi:hypothetical protein
MARRSKMRRGRAFAGRRLDRPWFRIYDADERHPESPHLINKSVLELKEHRQAIRKRLDSDTIFISLKMTSRAGHTLDVSTGGVSLTLPDPLPVGANCALSFGVPAGRKRARTLIRGTIVSCIAHGSDGFRVGIRFLHADATSRELIQAAVDCHLSVVA